MSSDNAVQELVSLVKSQKREPPKHTIDQLIPEVILHQYKPEDVLAAAHASGCIITQCCHEHNQYKANGLWVESPEELVGKLKLYDNLSSGYCPGCAEQLKAQVAYVQSLRQQKTEVAVSY